MNNLIAMLGVVKTRDWVAKEVENDDDLVDGLEHDLFIHVCREKGHGPLVGLTVQK